MNEEKVETLFSIINKVFVQTVCFKLINRPSIHHLQMHWKRNVICWKCAMGSCSGSWWTSLMILALPNEFHPNNDRWLRVRLILTWSRKVINKISTCFWCNTKPDNISATQSTQSQVLKMIFQMSAFVLFFKPIESWLLTLQSRKNFNFKEI